MQPNRWHTTFVMLSSLFALQTPAFAEDKIDIKVVKYAGLTDTIKKHKGKIVVVDFWADW
jgi:hypothetical protein